MLTRKRTHFPQTVDTVTGTRENVPAVFALMRGGWARLFSYYVKPLPGSCQNIFPVTCLPAFGRVPYENKYTNQIIFDSKDS